MTQSPGVGDGAAVPRSLSSPALAASRISIRLCSGHLCIWLPHWTRPLEGGAWPPHLCALVSHAVPAHRGTMNVGMNG